MPRPSSMQCGRSVKAAKTPTAPSNDCSQQKPTRMPIALMILTMARSTSLPVESRSSNASSTKMSAMAPADTARESPTLAAIQFRSQSGSSLFISHFDAKNTLQAKAIADVVCKTRRIRFAREPSANCPLEIAITSPTTRTANTRDTVTRITLHVAECSTWGSSRPSWLGRMPVMANRRTCTDRKDNARAATSSSASEESSAHWLSSSVPRRRTHSRTFSRTPPTPMSTEQCASTMAVAIAGAETIEWMCCRAHPALIDANPVMCAQSVPQHCVIWCLLPPQRNGSTVMTVMVTWSTIIHSSMSRYAMTTRHQPLSASAPRRLCLTKLVTPWCTSTAMKIEMVELIADQA
mmetsp:Transcript_69913/g.158680  ORF Transcript_69913/g.158680 Transcript_69913/m.158680 type:complete len:350 (+) Transcript_69913:345-1394(+)